MVEIVPMEKWWHLEYSIKVAQKAFSNIDVQEVRYQMTHPEAFYFVALAHGTGVKGFAGVKKTHANRYIWEFTWNAVLPEFQKQGIGRALVEKRVELVKEKGGRAIILSTGKPEVYEKYGFEPVYQIPGDWSNVVMMMSLGED